MKQVKFLDIEALNDENALDFTIGDHIVVSEKYDGSNASACYNDFTGKDTNEIVTFSRNNQLKIDGNTLSGFTNHIFELCQNEVNLNGFKEHKNYIVYGEWTIKNKLIYTDTNKVRHWLVFDIYDRDTMKWLPQTEVKSWCEKYNFEYIHILFDGKFTSFDDLKQYMNQPFYGEHQEGIVIKNQDKLDKGKYGLPVYVKMVNDEFKERMIKTKGLSLDKFNEKMAKYNKLYEFVNSVVNERRIEKQIFKLRDDENFFKEQTVLTIKDMSKLIKPIMDMIVKDVYKEESNTLFSLIDRYDTEAVNEFEHYAKNQTGKILKTILMKTFNLV